MLTTLFRSVWRCDASAKFSHTLFVVPFALASTALAARGTSGWPGWRTFSWILLAIVAGRTTALALNRIVDRPHDAANPSFKDPPLTTGAISLTGAWTLCGIGAGVLVLAAEQLNPLCLWLSPVALVLIGFYSHAKRYTDFTQVWLGLACALAPLGAWMAVKGTLAFWPDLKLSEPDPVSGRVSLSASAYVPLALAAAAVMWFGGFDLIRSAREYEFDRHQGFRSLATRWGPDNAVAAAFIAHLFSWGALVAVGLLSRFRLAYWIGLVVILAVILMEHILARRQKARAVQEAFFNLNATVSVAFLIVVMCEILFPWFRLRVYL